MVNRIAVDVLNPVLPPPRNGDSSYASAGSIAGCALAPSSGQAAPSSQETQSVNVDTTVLLFVPPTQVKVTAKSKLRFPDLTVWEVEGDPQWWPHPDTGWHPGGVIRLRRVRG